MDGKSHPFRGESWFDHEWATGQLAENQAGWDWICLQWEDGTELMLYQMRLKNGEPDSSSSGTWIAADGDGHSPAQLGFSNDADRVLEKQSERRAISDRLARYASGKQTEFVVQAALEDQELALGPITYWEGAIDASGTRDGKAIKGRGYLELTGYAGRLELEC